MSSLADDELGGHGRFVVRRRLGAGAYGVVYEAHDRERRLDVAVKRLHHVQPTAIYRFKQEFRQLADLSHPNLVQLHELLSDGQRWFFTMELVPGVPLLAWVRPGTDRSAETDGSANSRPTEALGEGEQAAILSRSAASASWSGPLGALDETRARESFRQLAEGVLALHGAGKLHRDLKSQNVLVTPEGRVVLLDFGLVHELGAPPARGRDAIERDIVGTPLYMAPEQGAGGTLTEAVDWYAMGVMLYRALTGEYPFEGRALEVIVAKQTRDAPRLAAREASLPRDLATLTDALLTRAPQGRPTGREVLSCLGPSRPLPEVTTPRGERPFVAREAELADLLHAYAETRRGRGVTVFVHGPSGVGKSALVARLLAELARTREPPLVLAGRCYSRESLPYKAIDGVIDALARHLADLPAAEVDAIVPPHVGELAALFPVLRRVRAVERESAANVALPDPIERRRRAFGALRELLTRLASRTPVVIFIDDLQWGDVDGAQALAQVMQAPEPPPLLLLGSYRSEEADTSPFLRAIDALEDPASPRTLRMPLAPLSPEESYALALSLVADGTDDARARASVIARESRGSPLFLEQLVAAQAEGRAAPTLAEVVLARIDALPEDARRVLEVLAVAAQPVEAEVVREVAGVASLNAPAVRTLTTARLVRTRQTHGREMLEPYHDRIRETAAAHVTTRSEPEIHRRLAAALEATGRADAERLATHYRAGGDSARAFVLYRTAAEKAVTALAFDRAASLFRTALEVAPPGEPVGPLHVAVGDALRHAGRGAEAARAYVAAAEIVTGDEVHELRRLAAEQLLYSGHVDEGQKLLDGVLHAAGLSFPKSSTTALLSFFARRAQLRLRGLSFTSRPAGSAPREKQFALDACWSVAIGLAMTEPIHAGIFQSLHMLLALETGDVERVARAFAVEVPFSATSGMRSRARTAMLSRRAKELAAEVGDTRLDGLLTSSLSGAAWLEGRWLDAIELAERADRILRTSCTGVAWEIDSTGVVLFDCLWRAGRWGEVAARYPDVLADARVRGDLFAETYFLVKFAAMTRLAQDEPAAASEELRRAIGRWTKSRFQLLHFWELHGHVETDLYRGQGAAAKARVDGSVAAVRGSLLLQLELYRISWVHLRGRAAVAGAMQAAAKDRERSLAEALSHAKALRKEGVTWADGLGALVEAGARATAGDREGARRALADAEASLERSAMSLHAAAARARRAELDGDAMAIERAHAEVAARGVRAPDRIIDVLAPGLF